MIGQQGPPGRQDQGMGGVKRVSAFIFDMNIHMPVMRVCVCCCCRVCLCVVCVSESERYAESSSQGSKQSKLIPVFDCVFASKGSMDSVLLSQLKSTRDTVAEQRQQE